MPRCISRLGEGWVLGALFVVSMLGFASTASAQFDRGTISGTIKDASGGVVPGVTVTATSVQTQTPTVAVTDATGFYTFPNLRPGQYVLTAELEGFKKIVRENMQLDAGGALTIDFALETGAITEQVTVTAETPLLQSDVAIRKVVECQGHRAVVLLGPQPDWRRQPQGRRRRRRRSTRAASTTSATAASTSTAAAAKRTTSRLTARRPSGRGRRATSSASRTSMRFRKCRSSRPTTCRSSAAAAAARSASSPRAAATASAAARPSSTATIRCRPTDGIATPAATRCSPSRRPFDYKQYGYSFGGPDPGGHVQGQAVLLRRAGVGELLPGVDGAHHRAVRGDATAATSASC